MFLEDCPLKAQTDCHSSYKNGREIEFSVFKLGEDKSADPSPGYTPAYLYMFMYSSKVTRGHPYLLPCIKGNHKKINKYLILLLMNLIF